MEIYFVGGLFASIFSWLLSVAYWDNEHRPYLKIDSAAYSLCFIMTLLTVLIGPIILLLVLYLTKFGKHGLQLWGKRD